MEPKFEFNISAYLRRIGLNEKVNADVQGLSTLQRAHMRHVPFENLDVFLRRPLSLKPQDLFRKIVTQNRGGYCFELNLLYGELLKAHGFQINPLLGRVWVRDPVETPALCHLIHMVELDGARYISDVGFGGRTSLIPLNINDQQPVYDGDGLIRICTDDTYGYMLQRQLLGAWVNQYSFTTNPVHFTDILVANHFMETHESSHFRTACYAGLFTKAGRIGLVDGQFSDRQKEDVARKSIRLGEDWLAVLQKHFGIDLLLTPEEMKRILAL